MSAGEVSLCLMTVLMTAHVFDFPLQKYVVGLSISKALFSYVWGIGLVQIFLRTLKIIKRSPLEGELVFRIDNHVTFLPELLPVVEHLITTLALCLAMSGIPVGSDERKFFLDTVIKFQTIYLAFKIEPSTELFARLILLGECAFLYFTGIDVLVEFLLDIIGSLFTSIVLILTLKLVIFMTNIMFALVYLSYSLLH